MRVLAVAANEKSAESISGLVREAGMECVPVTSAAKARQSVLDQEWFAVVINYPLIDESGMELARMVISETSASVIMIMSAETLSYYGSQLGREGILTVTKPVIKPVFFQTLRLAAALRERLGKMEQELRKMERRIEEMRIVGKAKCLLAANRGMSEEEAHKAVERTAMDMRITLRDAAMSIIRKESAR